MAEEAIQQLPEKGTPEYDEAMVKRFDQGLGDGNSEQKFEAPPTEIPPMPENGHEKFYNKETGEYNWQNHSTELQYRIDQQAKEPKVDTPTEEPKDSDVNWDELSEKLTATRTLETADYEKLQGIGIPKEVIDSYLELLATGSEAATQTAITYAGGQESMEKLFGWAQQNLTEEEIGNYNDILAGTNWRMGIDSLRVAAGMAGESTHQDAGGPQLMEGQNAAPSGSGFTSSAEMIEAMKDPKYKSDPSFRNQVRMRVGRSNF